METQSDKRPPAAATPYVSGYKFPEQARQHMKSWLRTSLLLTTAAALLDHATIAFAALTHLWIGSVNQSVWLITYVIGILIIALRQRALETLVHEGSHLNWCRTDRKRNDAFANAFAALPVFASVAGFRADHVLHHARIGTEADPCFRRYVWELDVDSIDRSSLSGYIGSIIRRIRIYLSGWWTGPFGISAKSLMCGAMWHVLVIGLPLMLVVGSETALMFWLLYFGVPFFLVLPFVRFMGEANKHRYTSNDGTVFGATFNNVGLMNFLLHPHGDNFHALHHLHPSIPHHQLADVDAWLMENDRTYHANLRRHTLLEHAASPHLSTEPERR